MQMQMQMQRRSVCVGARFYEVLFGARSVAGRMTALSLTANVRGHGFQMGHYGGCAGDPLMS
jgi:hypothetical protein